MSFPKDFIWGAATSAYQVEGSPLADGAGPSNWHRFSHTPGCVLSGDTGDIACDHYRRFEGDVRLMKAFGLNAYRFSVSWSRVLPLGRGRVNQKGLYFYQSLVDALLAQGIEPFITLYHWDLPATLEDQGGWLNRDSADWFGEYARVLFCALGDRVKFWITLNEPWVVMDAGYMHGVHPPGHTNPGEIPRVSHHLLLAHAAAVQACRAETKGQIGLVVNLEPKYPASDGFEDHAATLRAEAYMNRHYLDPVFLGRYPEALTDTFGQHWPDFPPEELMFIRQPIDFLGINYYTRAVVQEDLNVSPLRAGGVRQTDNTHTALGWEVYPQGLADTLYWVKRHYGDIPLYITENGAAFDDPLPNAGLVEDPQRVEYLRKHLVLAYAALRLKVNLRGYFVWSLLDNFEWTHGYSKRFGIFHVDFTTQRRTPKASAHFYGQVAQSRGGALMEYFDPTGS